jgi:hypothetical protein
VSRQLGSAPHTVHPLQVEHGVTLRTRGGWRQRSRVLLNHFCLAFWYLRWSQCNLDSARTSARGVCVWKSGP